MMETAAVDAWLTSLFSEALRPRPKDGVSPWAQKSCYIPAEVSPENPGYFRPDPAPLSDIVFYAYDSPEWNEFIGVKSSQYGLSFAAHLCGLYDATWKNRNILLSLDSEAEAKRVSQTRLQPLIQNCVDLGGKIDESETRGGDLTILLRGLTFFLTGSHSPSALANKTIGLGICDECDNYPAAPKGESNAIDLVRDRLKRVLDSMLIAFSKPKDEHTLIWPEFLSGSRHKCFLPCPDCGSFQELVREQLIYDHCKTLFGSWDLEKIENETFYRCANGKCSAPIPESEKSRMIDARVWKATNGSTVDFEEDPRDFVVDLPSDGIQAKPKKLSAHLSDLYQTSEKDTWGKIVAEWVDAEGSDSKKKRVMRGRFALPWREEEIRVQESDIDILVSGYRRGQCPEPPDLVLMAVDVQKECRKWVKTAWTLDGRCWVVDWGECLSYDALLEIADEPVKVLRWPEDVPEEDRVDPVVYKGLIDEGGGDGGKNDNQTPVRNWVISTFLGQLAMPDGRVANDFRFFSCYGRGGLQTKSWRDAYDPKPYTHNGWQSVVYRFNDAIFKRDLYEDRISSFRAYHNAKKAGDKNAVEPVRTYCPICPPGAGESEGVSWSAFRGELSQERRVWNTKKKVYEWQDPPAPNDYGDGLKMNGVLFYVIAPDMLRLREGEAMAGTVGAAEIAPETGEKGAPEV